LLTSFGPGMQGQVLDGFRFAVGVGTFQFWRIQARNRALYRALTPVEPEFAARLQLRGFPGCNQCGWQPFGPITLRQAHVGLGRAITPATGLDLGLEAQRDWLAIGQGQARIETLIRGANVQRKPYIGQGQRSLFIGFKGHLAVEHRQLRHVLQLLEQLLGIQRLIILHWQPFKAPVTTLVLAQAQLQAVELYAGDADVTVQQAGPHVGHHLHFIQTQGTVALADHHVVCQQHRRHDTPAAFKATDGQWHPQGFAGLVLHFYAVFSNQGGEFSAQADVQRRQHQNQGAQTQPPTGQRGKKACQTLHVMWPLQ